MKTGQGLMLVGLFAAAVGCGGASAQTGTSLDMCLMQGTWRGSGSCGVTTFDVSTSFDGDKVTLENFGDNPSVDFTADSAKTKLTANGLVILTASGHTCTISCNGLGGLALHCTNPGGGKCDSTFTPDTAVLR
jgi:hypothetical protein